MKRGEGTHLHINAIVAISSCDALDSRLLLLPLLVCQPRPLGDNKRRESCR
jgi:hypothetical protein